jgi:signal transduction histidine kinase
VAHWSDYLTDEICSAATGFTNHLCGNTNQSVTEFIDSLTEYLEQTFNCNAVTVLLEDFSGKRLEPVGRSREKVDWGENPPYYSISDYESHTFRTWKFREMVFSADAVVGQAREKRPEDDTRNEILFAPLVRRGGKCHGVARLHNKKAVAKPVSSMFTDDDAAKLDAIIQTALPHLELLKMQEQQRQSLARMVHEFQSPLVAIRGAVDLMQADLRTKEKSPDTYFRRDYLDDVLQWTELMGRLTRNAQIFAGGIGADVLRAQRTSLLSEVVMPVLRQIRPLVPDGVRFDCRQEDLHSIPSLHVDRNQMQQVFFNMLSNSIKYGGSSVSIRVRISGGPVGSAYSIFVEDWGSGIDENDREEVFQAGYRSLKAVLFHVSGQGLGLSVVRSIIEAHGGTIRVRSCRNPTTFEITLPQHLRHRPPDTSKSESA